MTRASPFQGEGCGFESHYLLKNRLPDGERRSAGMNSTVGPGRVQSLFLFGVVAQLAERYLCKVEDVGSNPICSTKRKAKNKEL